VIWLNGGPGCSSMDGFYLENGPVRFKESKLLPNKYSWHLLTDIVYVDQPSGTGYSSGKQVTDMKKLTDNFDLFFTDFLSIFREYTEFEIYLAGESFAGIYIPYIATSMLKNNINLKGAMVGNGWIEPKYQYPAWLEFSKQKNIVKGEYLSRLETQMIKCQLDMDLHPNLAHYQDCENMMQFITQSSMDGGQKCINKYDYTIHDDDFSGACGDTWPPGLKDLNRFKRNDGLFESRVFENSITC
jgi:carboxypeptidase D